MGSQYRYGIKKERQVARGLRRRGYKTLLSRASKGASDIRAQKGSKKWVIQVKSSRKEATSTISPNERRRLKIQARKVNATPVLAQVNRGKVRYYSIRLRRRLIA